MKESRSAIRLDSAAKSLFSKATVLVLWLASISSSAMAQGRAADLGGPITLGETASSQASRDDFDFVDSHGAINGSANIRLTAELSENIRAVLALYIRETFKNARIEQMLSDAYIRIDKVGGKPVAFIIGKQAVAFGNFQAKLPNVEGNPIGAANHQQGVIGFTVQLENVAFFDLVEASVFETTANDLKIGDVDGVSVRLNKEIGKKLKVVVSAMHKGNGSKNDDNRETVGFVFNDGRWTVWAEGVHMDGNASYPDSTWAASAGVEYKINEGQRVVVEGSYIAASLTRIAMAYEIQVANNVYVAPEVSYVMRPDGSGEWQFITRAALRFNSDLKE